MNKLNNKNIVFGITGSIAAYKACDIVSFLTKQGAKVTCILTKSANHFVSAKTLQVLSKNNVITDLFDADYEIEHISLSDQNDLFLILPATANIIAKFATGIADDFLSTFFLSNTAPVLIAPAMNSNMYNHKITQQNIQKLKNFDVKFIDPAIGILACGKDGVGKLAPKDKIIDAICAIFD